MAKLTILLGVTLWLFFGPVVKGVISDFCHSDLQIVSVFNLGEHIIFQDRYKTIWKLNETEMSWSSSKSIRLIEKDVKEDHRMALILSKYFDLRHKIFGFTFMEQEDSKCVGLDEDECLDINADPNIYYSCFFGFFNGSLETQKIEAFKYNYSELQEFESKSLYNKTKEYCINSTKEVINQIEDPTNDHLIGGLQFYQYNEVDNHTIRIRRKILINQDKNNSLINVYSYYEELKEGKIIKGEHNFSKIWIPYNEMAFIFRYRNLGVYGCPLYCTIKSNLSELILPDLWLQKQLGYNLTSLKIQDFIRCPDYKIWHSLEFCAQKGFQSIFNLGNDVVFQNNGKLWRYISTGADDYGNLQLRSFNNLQSIRFDSDMLSFLYKYFDTSLPIHGFTFKHKMQDMCLTHITIGSRNCQEHFQEFNLPYYRACIFGKNMTTKGEVRFQDIVEAFYYTPAGLQNFANKTIYNETKAFCQRISKSEKHRLTSILGKFSENSDGGTNLYALFKDESDNVYYYTTSLLHSFDIESDLKWNKLMLSNKKEERPHLLIYNWFNSMVLGMASKNNSNPFYEMRYEFNLKYDSNSNTFKKHYLSLYSLYNCPFNQSYSIAYMEEERPCTNFEGVYSVFQVQDNIYHQTGRRFYREIITPKLRNKRLVFDKYFTDLMNDIFDTNHRVIAVSYPLDNKEYRVFVLGKTKYNTRRLGDKIFRTFKVSYSPLAPIEAVNLPNDMLLHNDITFGFTDEVLKYSRFKGMAYINDRNQFLRPLVEKYPHNIHELGMLVLIVNNTHLYYTRDYNRFEFPFENVFNKWNKLGQYQEYAENGSVFSDIFGAFMYEDDLYVTAWPPRNETRDKPRVYDIYTYKPRINRTYFLLSTEKHNFWDLSEFFDCSQSEIGSESFSEETNDEIYFLIILIVLLILMGCAVAVIAWDRNRSNTKSDHKSDESIVSKNVKTSNNSTNAKTIQKDYPQSGQRTPQKTSDIKSLPQTQKKSSNSTNSSSGSSVIQTRSELGD